MSIIRALTSRGYKYAANRTPRTKPLPIKNFDSYMEHVIHMTLSISPFILDIQTIPNLLIQPDTRTILVETSNLGKYERAANIAINIQLKEEGRIYAHHGSLLPHNITREGIVDWDCFGYSFYPNYDMTHFIVGLTMRGHKTRLKEYLHHLNVDVLAMMFRQSLITGDQKLMEATIFLLDKII
jgi:hypothetical protein